MGRGGGGGGFLKNEREKKYDIMYGQLLAVGATQCCNECVEVQVAVTSKTCCTMASGLSDPGLLARHEPVP